MIALVIGVLAIAAVLIGWRLWSTRRRRTP